MTKMKRNRNVVLNEDNRFKPDYIELACLISLFIIFFMTLFLIHGNNMALIVDLLLLGLTAAVLGHTVAKTRC